MYDDRRPLSIVRVLHPRDEKDQIAETEALIDQHIILKNVSNGTVNL